MIKLRKKLFFNLMLATSKAKASKILAVLKQSLGMGITKMHPNYFSQYEDFRNTQVPIINKAVSESKLRELL